MPIALLVGALVAFSPLHAQPSPDAAAASAPGNVQKAKGEQRGKKAGAPVTKDGKPAEPKPGPATPEILHSEVTAPPEFEVTVFATPQQANYPVFLAASPEGTVYVASDGNGSHPAGTRPGDPFA
jgi:hypothetical protein